MKTRIKFDQTGRRRFMLALLLLAITATVISACASVQPGHKGVKKTFGKLDVEILDPGLVFYNPLVTDIVKIPVRTVNLEVKLNLPSKEGTNISAEISILYHINTDKVLWILEQVGEDFESAFILSTFRSASADVSSRHLAKDMHSTQRTNIGIEIADLMNKNLKDRGFVIENVLLKSIAFPPGLAASIEQKLQAEQDAERMKWLLDREQSEAKRKIVEAQGTRDSQKIISEGLTPSILKLRAIEAFRELSQSPNTKIIITDGKTPLLVPEASGK